MLWLKCDKVYLASPGQLVKYDRQIGKCISLDQRIFITPVGKYKQVFLFHFPLREPLKMFLKVNSKNNLINGLNIECPVMKQPLCSDYSNDFSEDPFRNALFKIQCSLKYFKRLSGRFVFFYGDGFNFNVICNLLVLDLENATIRSRSIIAAVSHKAWKRMKA